MRYAIWYHLYNEKKNRKKHPWRSVTFSKVAGLGLRSFSRFLNCTYS